MGGWVRIGTLLGTAVIAAVAGAWIWPKYHNSDIGLPGPDTPPVEYVYLDNERVLTYLGQLVGGLSPSETRTESLTEALAAGLKGGPVAELSRSRSQAQTVLQVVSPKASDRFYRLLTVLRDERSRRPWTKVEPLKNQATPWLYTFDAHPDSETAYKTFQRRIGRVHEGDFVRMVGAHLFLPPFASFFRKTRYVASWHPAGTVEPIHPPYRLHLTVRGDRAVKSFRRSLGHDVNLPFVVPITAGKTKHIRMTVFVPARLTRLVDNARLLAGNLTVVGKVIYKDPRLPGENSCHDIERPCRYIDRQTISKYAAALARAPASVRRILGLGDLPLGRIAASVLWFVRFDVPVLVVVPVAIYQ